MDSEVIEQKLESLRRCIQRIETKRPDDAKALTQDPDLQDIMTLNITRAIQLCVDIGTHIISSMDTPAPDTMGQTFDILAQANFIENRLAIRLKKAVGFRNLAVHNYETINWDIVYAIALNHVVDFGDFAKITIKYIQGYTPSE